MPNPIKNTIFFICLLVSILAIGLLSARLDAAISTQIVHITILDAPEPDTQAPSIPQSLIAQAVSSSQVDLSWFASTDDAGVVGYKIYRDSSLLSTVGSPLTTYSDTGLSPSTTYSYAVSAFDAAGNESGQSTSVSATTLSSGNTYYIAPLPFGSDTNLGTSSTPWATFVKAFSVMVGGDTLIVKDGTYNQSLKNPPSGTVSGYTTIKAEHNFTPIIDGEGLTAPPLFIQNGRKYIHIEGIYFKGANTSGNTEVATIGEDKKCCDQGQSTDGVSYINLFRNIFQGGNLAETNKYSKVLGVAVSNNITLEENICFGKANKYHFFAYKSSNITMRRNFARWDAVNTSTQGAGHPSASFIFYDTGNSIMENNVAVDGVHTSDTTTAAFYMAGHYIGGGNNQFLGNIALNNKANSAFEIDPGANFRSDGVPINWNNQTLTNNVAWLSNDDSTTPSVQDGLGVGINIGQSGTGGPYIDNVTVSHNTVGKNTKNRGISIHHNPTNTIFKNSLILFNNIAAKCSNSVLNINTSILFGNAATTGGSGCTINMSGNLSNDPGLMYLTRIESNSPAKGIADDGGDIGANVLKRYENGVLTGTDLWPFPNENFFKKVACTDIGETRGFCSAETLTQYIWEYLGNSIPPEIYGSTSGTTPP